MNGRVSKLIRKYCTAINGKRKDKSELIRRWMATPHNKRPSLAHGWEMFVSAAARGTK